MKVLKYNGTIHKFYYETNVKKQTLQVMFLLKEIFILFPKNIVVKMP
jgi:hypothetical protein